VFQIATTKLAVRDKDYRDLLSTLSSKVRDLKAIAVAREEPRHRAGICLSASTPRWRLPPPCNPCGSKWTRRRGDQYHSGECRSRKGGGVHPEGKGDREEIQKALDQVCERLRPGVERKVRAEMRATLQNEMARADTDIETLKSQETDLAAAVKKLEDESSGWTRPISRARQSWTSCVPM